MRKSRPSGEAVSCHRFFDRVTVFAMNFHGEKPLTIEKRGADEEAILALATTMRFFVQETDGISLRQIAEIYESLPVRRREHRRGRGHGKDERSIARSAVDAVDK